jgi:hypothetical protein
LMLGKVGPGLCYHGAGTVQADKCGIRPSIGERLPAVAGSAADIDDSPGGIAHVNSAYQVDRRLRPLIPEFQVGLRVPVVHNLLAPRLKCG